MRKKRRVGIIGHFGGSKNFSDGQTIKTKVLYNELCRATEWKIKAVDTYYKSKRPIKLLLETIACLITCEDVIVLLSGNGMKVYFPILWIFTKMKNVRIHHDVIGGNLDHYVAKYPKFRKYLNSFKENWVETDLLKKKLEAVGILNAIVIPNFKRLRIANPSGVYYDEPFRFCTFSRVMKEKGIEDAVEAIEKINECRGKIVCSLDIFGQIDKEYSENFRLLMSHASEAINYCGIVSFDKSTEVLHKYYAMLFPTRWHGEGFPGTVIDAYSAGLPVIASNWNSNAEFIDNYETGWVYPNEKVETLYDSIVWAVAHPEEMTMMRTGAVKKVAEYSPDKWIKKIIEVLEHK